MNNISITDILTKAIFVEPYVTRSYYGLYCYGGVFYFRNDIVIIRYSRIYVATRVEMVVKVVYKGHLIYNTTRLTESQLIHVNSLVTC